MGRLSAVGGIPVYGMRGQDLVPPGGEERGRRPLIIWAIAADLALAALAVTGFSRGWFQWPWLRRRRNDVPSPGPNTGRPHAPSTKGKP
jgi:hypothetical protein